MNGLGENGSQLIPQLLDKSRVFSVTIRSQLKGTAEGSGRSTGFGVSGVQTLIAPFVSMSLGEWLPATVFSVK